MGTKASFAYIVYDWCQQMAYKAKQLDSPKITPQVKKIVERELEVMTDTHDRLEAKFMQMQEEMERLKLENIRLQEDYFFVNAQYCKFLAREEAASLDRVKSIFGKYISEDERGEMIIEAQGDKAKLLTDLLTQGEELKTHFEGGADNWKGKIEKLQRLA